MKKVPITRNLPFVLGGLVARAARVTSVRASAAIALVAAYLASACGQVIDTSKCVGPAPVIFTDDSARLAAEERACAFDVSCSESNWWWKYDQTQRLIARSCLADFNLNGLDGVACAPNATTCGEWIACATHGYCAGWCTGQGYNPNNVILWTCDGDDVVVCGGSSDYGVVFEHCGQAGMHCQTADHGAACTDGSTCTQPANPHCDGNRVVGCDDSTLLAQSEDCGSGQCVDIDLGIATTAACVSSTATTCDPKTFASSCQGTIANGCLFDVVIQEDCATASIGGTCVVSNGVAQCIPTANECDTNTPDTCDGTSFVTCGTDQKLAHIDCTTLGFHGCGDIGGRVGCQ